MRALSILPNNKILTIFLLDQGLLDENEFHNRTQQLIINEEKKQQALYAKWQKMSVGKRQNK